MSIAIQAAELMERFQWLTTEEAQAAVENLAERIAVADEPTDMIIHYLSLSNAFDLKNSSAGLCTLGPKGVR
jgi:dCTP diphosphatase